MSSDSLSNNRTGPIPSQPRSTWGETFAKLRREPLLHFLAIGAVIFAIHAIVTPSTDKGRIIEITPDVREQITSIFRDTYNREPLPEEFRKLADLWILNEITYREALAQGLDKGDEMIRERVMQKMRLLIFDNLKVKDPTTEQITAWFEGHRERYDSPEVMSFFDILFEGPTAEQDANTLLQQIAASEEPEDVRLRARVFANRPRATLEKSFGKEFVGELAKLPIGHWQALQSQAGWHVVRLDTYSPGRQIPLREIASQVIADWKDDKRRTMGTAAVNALGKSYVIKRDPP